MKTSSALDAATTALPPLYAGWIRELLGGAIPRETEATCDDCAMCSGEPGPGQGSEHFFDPHSKCCTYTPELPNFLVGRVLLDEDPASAKGRATLLARLETGVGVTPLGLARSSAQGVLYDHVARIGSFGWAPALRCPHYLEEEGGLCGVWRHRNAVCATWFCKYARGTVGVTFWQSVLHLLLEVETELSTWCAQELDPGPESLQRLFPPPRAASLVERAQRGDLDAPMDDEDRRVLWGRWADRTREFYEECARRVNGLTWAEVLSICGPTVRVLAGPARAAYAALLSNKVPPALRVGQFTVIGDAPSGSRVSSYSTLDPVDLPRPLLGALHHFEGRSTQEALDVIAKKEGIRIGRGLLRPLVDFGILVPAVPPKET
jgi:hypothetical protein